MRNLRWDCVATRLRQARSAVGAPSETTLPAVAVEDLRDMLERGDNVAVVDVRLTEDFEAGRDALPTARYIDPNRIAELAADMPRDIPVAVYCVYGFWVSQDAVTALRARGVDARVVSGGIAAWHAMGGKGVPKPADNSPIAGGHRP
jgi:Fe-Mn family superoxide dismutase